MTFRFFCVVEFIKVDTLCVVIFVQTESEAHRPPGDPLLPWAADFIRRVVKTSVDVDPAMIGPSVERESHWIETGRDQKGPVPQFVHMLLGPGQQAPG